VKTFPRPGETLFGKSFQMFPGGKGANQAVCCAKLGAPTYFIGRVGCDVLGDRLIESLRSAGVRLNYLIRDNGTSSGIALITVNASGENEIVVVSGSNMRLAPSDLDRSRSVIARSGVLLTQLESPVPTVRRALMLAKQANALTILNPAPAQELPPSVLKHVDYLTPNETETEKLSGIRSTTTASVEKGAMKLLQIGVKNVIVTLGSRGCLLINHDRKKLFRAVKVKAVDTTAAGDAFSGALAYSLANGKSTEEAIEFATFVAAYSVTKMGAQTSMPTMEELRRFMS
jgi:ribokinase